MTTLRTAAQQALEALGAMNPYPASKEDQRASALAALRAALVQQAEPAQEPVAWIQPDHLQKARIAPFLCRVEPTQRCADFVPLYLAPPQRKPLTQEEIDRICASLGFAAISPAEIVRAVERAHGIGEQP